MEMGNRAGEGEGWREEMYTGEWKNKRDADECGSQGS